MLAYLQQGLDEDGVVKLQKELDRAAEIDHPLYGNAKPIRHLKSVPDLPKEPVPAKRWQAPPGWTPPGWNEERSYASAMQFMGFNTTMKKGSK